MASSFGSPLLVQARGSSSCMATLTPLMFGASLARDSLNISASWLPIFAATGIAASRRAVATISTIPNVRTPGAMEPEAFAEYLRCYDSEATVHAVCEDYRATAGIDLHDDAKDAAQRIWARLLAWRERATKVEGSL